MSPPTRTLPASRPAWRQVRPALLLLLGLGCAGPDLGPSRGTQGPAWIPDQTVRSTVGAVGEAQRYRAQRASPRPVHFLARGERAVLERSAVGVLRTHGFILRPRLMDDPLATRRQDAGLGYGTVDARPAVLTRSYVLSLEPLEPGPAEPPRWALTLRAEVERCVAADTSDAGRRCVPQAELPPELQQELQDLGAALRSTLAPEAATDLP